MLVIKRKYDSFNNRCYIIVKCDFCGFQPVCIDGYGISSKKYFSSFEKMGWKHFDDGRIICSSCDEITQGIYPSLKIKMS